MRPTLALFDVDGTLVAPPSSEVRFVRWLRARRLIGVRHLAAYLRRLPERLWRAGGLAFKTNKGHFAGFEAARLAELADAFVASRGADFWIPDAVERLRGHLARGDRVVLLTGTPDVLAAALARRLGVEDWRASGLPQRDGRMTGAPPRDHPWGRAKLEIARQVAADHDLSLAAAWAYGDAWGDRFLLEAVGHPVAVRPGARLERLAALRGWERMAAGSQA